jgi:GNAT superfamily N-acetyltransferase
MRPEDLDRVVALRNLVYPDDPVTVDEFVAWGERSPERADVVATDDGAVVGAARAYLGERPDPWAHIWVAPRERRRGAGQRLLGAISQWAEAHGHSALEGWVRADADDGLAFARGRGFGETGRELELALDLRGLEAPAVEPPAGIEIVTWAERPELAHGLYEVALEAIPDVPGEELVELGAFGDWLARDMQSAGDRPDATFVAVAGDEVVAYSKFAFSEAQPAVAHHDITGVKRAWRGRGIARALKAAQIRWALEHGLKQLRTRNEDRNAPIRRLNERFGYRPFSARIILRGPLSGSGS